MLKLLKTAFKHRDATVAYPAKPMQVDPNFRGKPEYNPEQCIACGACTAACPANALTMETNAREGRALGHFIWGAAFSARAVKKSAQPPQSS